jgi:hypothetical protein
MGHGGEDLRRNKMEAMRCKVDGRVEEKNTKLAERTRAWSQEIETPWMCRTLAGAWRR